MNYALIKYVFSKIYSQPLTKLLLISEILIIAFFMAIKIESVEGKVISVDLFGSVLDEPYIIQSISNTVAGLIFTFINFLFMMICVRLFSEGYKDHLLEIILPKLNKTSDYYLSQLTGVVIWFFSNLAFFYFIIFTIFSIRLGEIYLVLLFVSVLYIMLDVLYISVISAFFSLLFDGYSAFFLILIPYLFGNVFANMINLEGIGDNIFAVLFPLLKINNFFENIFLDHFSFDLLLLLTFPLLALITNYSISFFNDKWK